jgi:acyl-CoA thioester hydrolase
VKELKVEIELNIRFSDTDAMGVVWHGNYLRFFEDAREAFGNSFDLRYLDMYNEGYFTPIVKSEINHKSPLYYGDKVKAIAHFHPSPAAKLIFEYEIFNLTSKSLSASGKTIQIFLNAKDRTLELNKPDFIKEWENKMKLNN